MLDTLPEPVRAGPLAPAIQGLTVKDPGLRLTAAQATALLAGPPRDELPGREADEFTVVLHHAGRKKIQVIKVVYETVSGIPLKEARDLVDRVPQTVLKTTDKNVAEDIKRKLEEAGAAVALTQGAGQPVDKTRKPTREYTTTTPPTERRTRRSPRQG